MDKYEEWFAMSLMLKDIKAKEAIARRELCSELFDGRVGDFKVVHETATYKVVAKSGVSRSLDADAYEAIEDDLTPQDREAIRFKPSLVKKLYDKLPKDSLLHEIITEKPSMPTMTMERL